MLKKWFSVIVERPGAVVVRASASYWSAGVILGLLAAVLVPAGVIVLLAAPDSEVWKPLLFMGGFFGLFSVVYAVLSGTSLGRGTARLDLRERAAELSDGRTLPFRNVRAVELVPYTKVYSADGHRMPQREWAVLLALRADVQDRRTSHLEGSLASSPVLEALNELRLRRRGPRLQLTSGCRTLQGWRAAERIARAIKVPLVDYAGGRGFERGADELDSSLVDLMARRGVKLEEPPDPPSGAGGDSDGGTLRLEWRHSRWGMMALFGLFGVGLLIMVPVFLSEQQEAKPGSAAIAWAIFGPVAAFLFGMAAWYSTGHGRNLLTCDDTSVAWQRSFPWKKTRALPLDDLEAVHLHEHRAEGSNALLLVSDRRAIEIPIRKEVGAWVRQRLLHHLAGVARARSRGG